jgi:hypothetical protein
MSAAVLWDEGRVMMGMAMDSYAAVTNSEQNQAFLAHAA